MSGNRAWAPMAHEEETVYNDQVKELISDLNQVIKSYRVSFDELREERAGDMADMIEQEEMLFSFIDQCNVLLFKIINPQVDRLGNFIYEIGSLLESLDEQWSEVPAKLDLLKQQRDELAAIKNAKEAKLRAEQQKLSEINAIQMLTQAVTFSPKPVNPHELDLTNKSKLTSKQHHEGKKHHVEAYQAQYPNESSPMYTKQGFFKIKEQRPTRAQFVREELEAYKLGEQDMRDDMQAMENDALDDDMAVRIALLK